MTVNFRRTTIKPNIISTLGEQMEVLENYGYSTLLLTGTTEWTGDATVRLSIRNHRGDCTS